nr:hypothetical protein [Tanacetum cinerariifolium]
MLGGCWELMGKVVGVVWRWWSGVENGEERVSGVGGKTWEGRGSGVEVVEWSGEWGREGEWGWRENLVLEGNSARELLVHRKPNVLKNCRTP